MANPTAPPKSLQIDNRGLYLKCKGLIDDNGVLVLTTQQGAAIANTATTALTLDLSNLEDGSANRVLEQITALTDYTPHTSGATTVTSNAATDLDTTAAALETFRDEQAALNLKISRAFDKTGDQVNALQVDSAAHTAKINAIIALLEDRGLIAD